MLDFCDYLKYQHRHSSHTIDLNERNVQRFQRWAMGTAISMDEPTHRGIMDYIRHLANRGNEQSSIYQHLNSLDHYFSYLIFTGEGRSNPIKNIKEKLQGIRRGVLHDIIALEDLHQLYRDYPTATSTDMLYKIIVGLLVFQGITTGEMAKIELHHLDLDRLSIFIPSCMRSNSRVLPLDPEQIYDLQTYLYQTRERILLEANKESRFFIVSTGKSDHIHGVLQSLMKRLKTMYPDLTYGAKQIRASVIAHWLKEYDLRKTQRLAGHKFLSSTERYEEMYMTDELREDLEMFHPLG